MARPKPWLKLWTEIRRDAKLTRVEPSWRWVWVALLTLAQESDAGGKILNVEGGPMCDQEIAQECGVAPEVWEKAKTYFSRVRTSSDGAMLGTLDGAYYITQHAKRQAVDPTNSQRQARYRSGDASRNALRNASRNGTEHQSKRASEDRGQSIEDREQGEKTSSSSSSATGQRGGDGADQSTILDGLLNPPNGLTNPEQCAAWELLYATAPDFGNPVDYICNHNPYLVGIYALIVGERTNVNNPAGLIRSLVESGSPPIVYQTLNNRYLERVKYWGGGL